MTKTSLQIPLKLQSLDSKNLKAFQKFFFLLQMDLETLTKASECLKNHKFLIYDEKQHPKNFWFRGC